MGHRDRQLLDARHCFTAPAPFPALSTGSIAAPSNRRGFEATERAIVVAAEWRANISCPVASALRFPRVSPLASGASRELGTAVSYTTVALGLPPTRYCGCMPRETAAHLAKGSDRADLLAGALSLIRT